MHTLSRVRLRFRFGGTNLRTRACRIPRAWLSSEIRRVKPSGRKATRWRHS